ncbi:cytochrome c maturation protein CcmE [Roseovarius spongiae]|uniref:Cytochrome c-type biogenesis protein CcmE n=1 Tax=Roseovarius spongiae TaxID=2320272 RepID=A0A3A8AQT2_9RHOB|nr:cytochrome c maturation protein CcmE [Roseovarius spongiae]RKF12858.1 cytochrome c maturation protein CcmE [Roseovarius spongiae]
MASLRKARRVRLIAFASVALVLATTLIGYAMRDGIQFFRTPSQALATAPDAAEIFRLGGMVEPGSLVRDGASVRFRLTDGEQAIAVSYSGLLPDLFAENEGAIATGALRDGEFRATEILAKHDEDYMPRELADLSP